jgi:hypothetical protein
MVVLDATIVNVALPHIQAGLLSNPDGLELLQAGAEGSGASSNQ